MLENGHYLGKVSVGPNFVFQPFAILVLVKVFHRETVLSSGPLLRLRGIFLQPLIGIWDLDDAF